MPGADRVRAAEVIAALSLATDYGTGLPFEHGLRSTLAAMRLGERLGIDGATAAQIYYVCLLFYVGCTADAQIGAELFGERLPTVVTPVLFGSRFEQMRGVVRALAPPDSPAPLRLAQLARTLPRAVRERPRHLAAVCEVAQMLSDRLGLPASVRGLFAGFTERWDGAGEPGRVRGEQLPLPVRIVHVARDACLQEALGGAGYAARTIRERAGGAFDPAIAGLLADEAGDILAPDSDRSLWDRVLDLEPAPLLLLEGQAVDRALAAMGDFADLASPYLAGHSAGVAQLAGSAAETCGLPAGGVVITRRAAYVHDLGRVAVPVRIWQKAGPLSSDEWERVRLHAYHGERMLARSPFLAALGPVATAHHERCDGSGYHRGLTAAALPVTARLLAAADAYSALTEPRPHRGPLAPERAAEILGDEARAGRLDADAVAAVLRAAGHRAPVLPRPAGLTEREAQVIALVARGLQTKQVARTLGISLKTADHHLQNAYGKIGVATRAAAALFAMEHGLLSWGELPMGRPAAQT